MTNIPYSISVILIACVAFTSGCGPTGESPAPSAKTTPPAAPPGGDKSQSKAKQSFDAFYKVLLQRKQPFAGTTISASDFQTKSTKVMPDPRDPSLWVAQVELGSDQGPGTIVVLYEQVDGRWKFHFDRSFMDIGESPEPLPRSFAPDEPPALGDIIEAAFHE